MTTDPTGALAALVRVELRRLLAPTARGMLPVVLFAAWGALRDPQRPDQVVFALTVAVFMAPLLTISRIGYDRADGTLAYLASLPLSGELLAAVRILSSAIVTGIVCILLVLIAPALLPDVPSAVVLRGVFFTGGFAIVSATLLVGPLARFNWTVVAAWAFGIWLAAGVLLELTGWDDHIGEALSGLAQRASLPASVILVAGLAWGAVALLAVGAFFMAARGLQPNGGKATDRALATLRKHQREGTR